MHEVIDTHVHVFARSLSAVPQARYVPAYDALWSDLQAQWASHGVQRGVLVQPSFLGTDNRYMLQIAQQHPDTLRCVVVMASDTTAEQLLAMHAQGARGIRLNWVGLASLPDVRSATWPALCAQMRSLGWHIELHIEGPRLAQAAAQLQGCGLQLVIDHMGRPEPGMSLQQHAQVLLTMAESSQCFFKLSAPYRSAAGSYAQLLPLLLPQLGYDSLLWGSDWPWTNFEQRSYGGTIDDWQALVPEAQHRQRINHNAEMLYFS